MQLEPFNACKLFLENDKIHAIAGIEEASEQGSKNHKIRMEKVNMFILITCYMKCKYFYVFCPLCYFYIYI